VQHSHGFPSVMGPARLAADDERPATHVRVSGALCRAVRASAGLEPVFFRMACVSA
jgi:hypothetical protein